MAWLIAGVFLLNAGITVLLVTLARNRAYSDLIELERKHFELFIYQAEKHGRVEAALLMLEAENANR
jgi:hypothetical protein